MSHDLRTPLLGTLGTASTFTLAQVSDALGIVAGLLSIAYLVRQHVHFRREKK